MRKKKIASNSIYLCWISSRCFLYKIIYKLSKGTLPLCTLLLDVRCEAVISYCARHFASISVQAWVKCSRSIELEQKCVKIHGGLDRHKIWTTRLWYTTSCYNFVSRPRTHSNLNSAFESILSVFYATLFIIFDCFVFNC